MPNYDDRMADYVDVAERIRIFRDQYPHGSLQPVNPMEPFRVIEIGDQTFIAYTAAAYRSPDDTMPGIAVSWEPFPGTTPYTRGSEVQNAETAAWGRAIVAALAADTKKVASLDEVRARKAAEPSRSPQEPRQASERTEGPRLASDGAKRFLRTLAHERGYDLPDLNAMTAKDAYDLTEKLKGLPRVNDPAPDQEEPF